MNNLNLYTASQITLSIALVAIISCGFVAVIINELAVSDYKIMLIISVLIMVAQMLTETARHKQAINI